MPYKFWDAQEKINFVKNKIKDLVAISPSGLINYDIYSVKEDMGDDSAPVVLGKEEQKIILKMLLEKRYIEKLEFFENYRVAQIFLPQNRDEEELDIISVKLKSGTIELNKSTGFIKFNKVESFINIKSNEFKVLLNLLSSKDYQASYENLLGEEKTTKVDRRLLGFTIRNIKQTIGILPKKDAKNKDCIQNIKNWGYKLITK